MKKGFFSSSSTGYSYTSKWIDLQKYLKFTIQVFLLHSFEIWNVALLNHRWGDFACFWISYWIQYMTRSFNPFRLFVIFCNSKVTAEPCIFLFLSNYSSGTIVFIDASYNGSSRMKNFNGIYEALYKQKSLGDLHIEVMDDNSMY